jgi:hypothetical protein
MMDTRATRQMDIRLFALYLRVCATKHKHIALPQSYAHRVSDGFSLECHARKPKRERERERERERVSEREGWRERGYARDCATVTAELPDSLSIASYLAVAVNQIDESIFMKSELFVD